ncbi:MAG: hypothetical protein FWF51_00180 [Chitinivibrionia bacterium]|nr:hypothetical protein [Chitinivibrionia bacterium]
MFGNKKGVSMLYVLMALVCVGAIGTLVLNMAKKEKADSSLRYSSELARYGATSGLVLSINFSDATKTTEFKKLLTKWHKYYHDPIKYASSKPDDSEKWLQLSPTHSDPSKYYEDVNNNGMKYRARIINMDFSALKKITGTSNDPKTSPINIAIECESIDKSGSRAKNVAFYKVYGFEEQNEDQIPSSALYLGGGIGEINTVLEVTGVPGTAEDGIGRKGDTFLKGGGNVYYSGHIFNGEFRRRGRPADPLLTTSPANVPNALLQGATFNGPAYFGLEDGFPDAGLLFQNQPCVFNGNFGSETTIIFSGTASPTIFNGDVFLNGNAISDKDNDKGEWRFNQNSKLQVLNTALYGKFNGAHTSWTIADNSIKGKAAIPSMYSNSTEQPLDANITENTTPVNLYEKLKIKSNDPPSIDIDLTKLDAFTDIHSLGVPVNGITGTHLNNLYNSNHSIKHNNEPNGWMLLSTNQVNITFTENGGGVPFTGKMVLLFNGNGGEYGSIGNLFTSSNNSNSLILFENGRSTMKMGNKGTLRGLVVKRGAGKLGLGMDNPINGVNTMTLKGAAYCVQGENYVGTAPEFRLEGGNSQKIIVEYDPSVLKEIQEELPGAIKIVGATITEPVLEEIMNYTMFGEQQSRLF